MLSDGYVTARRIPEDILLKKETEPDCKVHLGDEQTLPKAQRTRGLSSYHKFKHKS